MRKQLASALRKLASKLDTDTNEPEPNRKNCEKMFLTPGKPDEIYGRLAITEGPTALPGTWGWYGPAPGEDSKAKTRRMIGGNYV